MKEHCVTVNPLRNKC